MQLHTKAKMFSLHQKVEIMDEDDKIVYSVESKALSIHNTTYIHNAKGEEIAVMTRKPISMHETHEIEMTSGEHYEMQTELLHLMDDVINIDGLGWTLHGDVLKHNYEFADGSGNVIAKVHHKWVSVHDVYYIDVLDESQIDRIVCIYVALQKIIREREQRITNESEPTKNNTTKPAE